MVHPAYPAFQLRFRPVHQTVAGSIQYAHGHSSLGRLLVARNPHGICAILIGDDDTALLVALRDAFARAELVAASDALHNALTQITRCVDGEPGDAGLTLDLGGTPFQQNVWRALLSIPAGQTRSYAEMASTLNLSVHAARAVGRACAANLLAVAIPCHRVVRSDGALANYRWGIERKRTLLNREKSPG